MGESKAPEAPPLDTTQLLLADSAGQRSLMYKYGPLFWPQFENHEPWGGMSGIF